MLMNLSTLDWDDELLAAFGIPRAILPEIVPSSAVYGDAVGDARRRARGRRARRPAGGPVRPGLLRPRAKRSAPTAPARSCCCTPATGRSPASAAWSPRSRYRIGDAAAGVRPGGLDRRHRRTGAVAARQPRPDQLRGRGRTNWPPPWPTTAAATSCQRSPACSPRTGGATRAASSPASPGTSPRATSPGRHWKRPPGRSRRGDGDGRGVRGAMRTLKVDGGMTASDLLMQFQADVLDVPVVRPTSPKPPASARPTRPASRSGSGPTLTPCGRNWRADRRWQPAMTVADREHGRQQWDKAVRGDPGLGRVDAYADADSGSRTRKVVPVPGTLSTVTLPWCAATRACTIASPSRRRCAGLAAAACRVRALSTR